MATRHRSPSRSHSSTSDNEVLELELSDEEDVTELPPTPKITDAPKVRLTTKSLASLSHPETKATPKIESAFKRPEPLVSQSEIDELYDDIIEIDSDEEIPVESEEEEETKKSISHSGFRVSKSRGKGAPKARVGLTFPYRNTSRITVKAEPDFNDLWGVFGKYFTSSDLDTLLSNATNEEEVNKFNQRNGTSFKPAKSDFAIKKSQARTLPKSIRVARALLSPTARMMGIEMLMKTKRTDKSANVFPSTFSLSNDRVYIQFTEGGPKFSGDHPDNREMEEAAGLVSTSEKKGAGSSQESPIPKEFTLQIPDVIPPQLIYHLREAIAEDVINPIRIDQERLEWIEKIVYKLAEMNIDQLEETDNTLKYTLDPE